MKLFVKIVKFELCMNDAVVDGLVVFFLCLGNVDYTGFLIAIVGC